MPRKRAHTRRKPKGNPRGTLSVSSAGFGFVQTAEGEFFVPAVKLNGAFDGDLVEVAPLPREYMQRSRSSQNALDQKPAARVVSVVQRAHDTVVGRFEIAEPFGVVVPEDPRLTYDIFTRLEDNPNIPDGSIVSVRITAFPTRNSAACGVVEQVLGDSDDERVPIDLIVARYKLETSFSDEAKAQAKQARLDEQGALNTGYRDLRDRFVFTVDPADAKDFDDAVSLEPANRAGARWRLGVHIADVGHYVAWNSPLDIQARRRSTSVYLVDRVIPMLPEELSNDLCSLRPHEVRRTMTVDIYLNEAGNAVDVDIYQALIRSCARLSYDQALNALERARMQSETRSEQSLEVSFDATGSQNKALFESENRAPSPFAAHEGSRDALNVRAPYSMRDIEERLVSLSRIAKLRAKARRARGGIDFDTKETRVRLDDKGVPIDVDIREKNDATELIEEAMLLANEMVARYLHERDFPCAYRVHERPAFDNLEGLLPVLQEFSWFKRINETQFLSGNPQAIARVIDESKGRVEHEMVASLLLRAMMRAVYSPECLGHFGLASDVYCHFTSPIRRYPDLIVHRMLKAALTKRPQHFDQEVSALALMCDHASKQERIAEKVSRESHMVKLVELMEAHIGETYQATVSGVASYGLFVRLENTAEGLVRIEDLGREYFYLDAVRHKLVGSDTGRVYRLGQQMDVILVAADRRTRQLDFKPLGKRKKAKQKESDRSNRKNVSNASGKGGEYDG